MIAQFEYEGVLIGASEKTAALYQTGDNVKVSFMLPRDELSLDQIREAADQHNETITLYRNTVWLEFVLVRRSVFVLAHSEKREMENLTLHLMPASDGVRDVFRILYRKK